MDNQYCFEDALTGARVTCALPLLDSTIEKGEGPVESVPWIFFPGCSLLNFGLPLIQPLLDLLKAGGRGDGVTLLCCGKILPFEPDGEALQKAFFAQLIDAVADAGVEGIVAACPNCAETLTEVLASDPRTAHVEIVPLSQAIADIGYRIDPDITKRVIVDKVSALSEYEGELDAEDSEWMPSLYLHLSCPDREGRKFDAGLRKLLSQVEVIEGRKMCCGSIVKAAGKFEESKKVSARHGQAATDQGADAIVVGCMSCAQQLGEYQGYLPCVHYLELLYDWPIDWYTSGRYMKLRFLIDDLGEPNEKRAFAALGATVDEDPQTPTASGETGETSAQARDAFDDSRDANGVGDLAGASGSKEAL